MVSLMRVETSAPGWMELSLAFDENFFEFLHRHPRLMKL